MALGDGIRRNIAAVDPTERALLRDAFLALNRRFFPGTRNDPVTSGDCSTGGVNLAGGVSWWFKQDEIHQATHVHNGPEFVPWHREIVNRLEQMLRLIDNRLSLHYWDWTQDPRAIPNANLGGGTTGTLNLFTPDFMGYGGSTPLPIGDPWLGAGYYAPGASPDRNSSCNPADPPAWVTRSVNGSPASQAQDEEILAADDYAVMRRRLEIIHNDMHGFVNMGGAHISFRDPFVFLLHSNVDRLFARWQTTPRHQERLDPGKVYGSESDVDVPVGGVIQNVNHNVEPWSTGHSFDQFNREHFTRPWYAPESEGVSHTYKHSSIVTPPRYDTNYFFPGLFAAEGRVSFFRVHDVGTRFGPPGDQLDAEVIVRLSTLPDLAFGFQLRADGNEAARKGMLDTLRTAFNRDRRVRLDYLRTSFTKGVIIRVADLV